MTFALRAQASLISPQKSPLPRRDRLSVGSIPPETTRSPAVRSYQTSRLQIMGLQHNLRLIVRGLTPYAPFVVMRCGQERNPLVKTRTKAMVDS